MSRVLVLGGTAEARAFADRAAGAGHDVIYSLAGRTVAPRLPACELRTGPFGGSVGLARYLREHDVSALVDATHPFADAIPFHAAGACTETAIPRLKLIRPPWEPEARDRWIKVSDMTAAAAALIDASERVFLAVGLQELAAFAELTDILFLVRTVDEPTSSLPLPAYKHIAGRGPFTLTDERELLARHLIDTVVCKNSGGESSRAKLAAARDLGIRVVMLDRPPHPNGPIAATVEEALTWLEEITCRT